MVGVSETSKYVLSYVGHEFTASQTSTSGDLATAQTVGRWGGGSQWNFFLGNLYKALIFAIQNKYTLRLWLPRIYFVLNTTIIRLSVFEWKLNIQFWTCSRRIFADLFVHDFYYPVVFFSDADLTYTFLMNNQNLNFGDSKNISKMRQNLEL